MTFDDHRESSFSDEDGLIHRIGVLAAGGSSNPIAPTASMSPAQPYPAWRRDFFTDSEC